MTQWAERARSIADDSPALDAFRGAEVLARDVVAHAEILPIGLGEVFRELRGFGLEAMPRCGSVSGQSRQSRRTR